MKYFIKLIIKQLLNIKRLNQALLDMSYREYEATVLANLIKTGHKAVLSGPFQGLALNTTHSNKNFRVVHLLGFFETSLQKPLLDLLKHHKTVVNLGMHILCCENRKKNMFWLILKRK